ncbi:polyprenyl synthetase family protein [bacterium]|nr:polyprenyl synthetase family protein [bacterium]
MANSLSEISKLLNKELALFKKEFHKTLKSDIFLVDKAIQFISASKNSGLRSSLLLLITKMLSDNCDQKAYKGAIAIELLHTAMVLHSEVTDEIEDNKFRLISKRKTNKLSILLGDFMLSRSLVEIASTKNLEAINIFSKAATKVTESEIYAQDLLNKNNFNEEAYAKLISDKYSLLISASCELGAILSGNSNSKIQNSLKNFGQNLGIIFWLQDDLFKLSKNSIFGKPLEKNIKEFDLGLPLVYAIQNAPQQEVEKFLANFKTSSDKLLANFSEKYGGFAYTYTKIYKHLSLASENLENLENGAYKTALSGLVNIKG